jgi:arylsulfatase
MRSLLLTFLFFITLASLAQTKKPNIIIILADDMGYSDIGSFGSEIKTPNLDYLAKSGTRLTQFYNASRCCPARASLLTGLYQHQAGVGHMVNERTHPSYQGYLNDHCITIAEALKTNGYQTFMAGKWHVGEKRPHWPLDRGFDRYFGLINGANSYFENRPYRPNQKLNIVLDNEPYTTPPNYYATDAYTDFALQFIEQGSKDKPFFLYLAYTAPHWPLHALPEDIKKYKGKYLKGWDVLRKQRLEKMKQSGIVSKSTSLSPRDTAIPDWNSLSNAEKTRWDDKMAVYAAMIDRMDQNIGRLQKKLKELGQDKNTLIFFLSDNGASNEDIDGAGFTPEIIEANKKMASERGSFTAYETVGANVSNTPFRQYKHTEFEGGTASPFIAYLPGMIKAGRLTNQPAHIIDLMATCLDVAGAPYPSEFNGQRITPLEGISLKPLLIGQEWKGHDALFFEHEGNRAVRQGKWKLVSEYPKNQWQLYDIEKDRSERNDVSSLFPQKKTELIALYEAWAKHAGVVPFGELEKAKKGE